MAERLSEEQILEYSARITSMIQALEQSIEPMEQPKGWKRLIARADPILEELRNLPTKVEISVLNNFKLGMLATVGQVDIESYFRLREVDMKIIEITRRFER